MTREEELRARAEQMLYEAMSHEDDHGMVDWDEYFETEEAQEKIGDLFSNLLRVDAEARQEGAEESTRVVRPEVWAFALAMEERLAANDHKGGWDGEYGEDLLVSLRGEIEELAGVMFNTDTASILHEASDVANFAMMIADVFCALPLTPESEEET